MNGNSPENRNVIYGDFEWDSMKNDANQKKHGIAFEGAIEVFEGSWLKVPTDHSSEKRWIALGKAKRRVIAVIYTKRNDRIRMISARMAREDERAIYQDRIGDIS
jgi:uncharacterized DUF497 family protein